MNTLSNIIITTYMLEKMRENSSQSLPALVEITIVLSVVFGSISYGIYYVYFKN